MTEASDRYEQAFQAIAHHHRQELGYGSVEPSKHYKGKISKARRQIDATIHLPTGELIMVECKRYKQKVDLPRVEGFDAKVRLDLGYEGAIMVSCRGFSRPAIKYAKSRNIGLITLNSTATKDEYIMKMEDRALLGFLDPLVVSEEVSLQTQVRLEESVAVSEKSILQTQLRLEDDPLTVSEEASPRSHRLTDPVQPEDA